VPEDTTIGREHRSPFERDLDRLLYTFYYKRLAEITQVASYSGGEDDRQIDRPLLTNRITHSQKVGQIARRIVQYLFSQNEAVAKPDGWLVYGGLDPDVAQFAGLAHDLGHPPFGHIGEQVLDEFARSAGLNDGFEGNAQTFRILTRLARHLPREEKLPLWGLDVTSAALASCVKYPWPRERAGAAEFSAKRWRKFGYYDEGGAYLSDAAAFDEQVRPLLRKGNKTLEAAVMDWADDIAYAVHDLEDFSLTGAVPLSALRHTERSRTTAAGRPTSYTASNPEEVQLFLDYAKPKIDAAIWSEGLIVFKEYATMFPEESSAHGRFENVSLDKLSSKIITDASEACSITADGDLWISPGHRGAVEILKQLTWYYVIDNHRLVSVQRGQRTRLRAVLDGLYAWICEAHSDSESVPWAAGEVRTRSGHAILSSIAGLPPRLQLLADGGLAAQRQGAKKEQLEQVERERVLARVVVDYVASLREREVDEIHDRLHGRPVESR